ncbi:hypothetical protein ACFXKD_30125 [Nocardiopsis aegyptia]|uniref:hypothetical protein n=1 Tax=Nocardiopsis aegyptia TaxID=220378 RepID=UPI00366DE368
MDAAVLVVFVVVVTGALLMMQRSAATSARRGRQELADWARTRGLSYAEQCPDLARRFSGPPFVTGVDARASRVVSGRWRGRSVTVYEYAYMSDAANVQSARAFTVVAVATDATPVLQVRGQHVGDRLLERCGVHGLKVGERAFDERFHVRTDDPDFARAVLDRAARGWLVAHADAVPFRLTGDHLLLWSEGTLAPERIRARVDTAVDLVGCLLGPAGG